MALIFNCQECNQPFSVPDNLSGLMYYCPHCGCQMRLDRAMVVGQIDDSDTDIGMSYEEMDDDSDVTSDEIPEWATDQESLEKMLLRANPIARLSYWLGLISLIPCIGFPIAFWAIRLGIRGLKNYFSSSEVGGLGFALSGIVLGTLVLFGYFALIFFALRGMFG